MFFSIAPQSITIPGGPTLDFRVNPSDSSICEIHIAQPDGAVRVMSFKRNGVSAGPDETFATAPDGTRKRIPDDGRPLAGFRSVDEDPVRGTPRRFDSPQTSRTFGDLDKSATGEAKVDPVHGKINTVGLDNLPAKPPEGKLEDASPQDKRDRAATGIQPPEKTSPVDQTPAA